MKAWGKYKVREADIRMGWVRDLVKQGRVLEIFGAGTACIVCPVNRIHYQGEDLHIPTIEHDKPIYDKLKTAMTDIQYGRIEHPWAVVID